MNAESVAVIIGLIFAAVGLAATVAAVYVIAQVLPLGVALAAALGLWIGPAFLRGGVAAATGK